MVGKAMFIPVEITIINHQVLGFAALYPSYLLLVTCYSPLAEYILNASYEINGVRLH